MLPPVTQESLIKLAEGNYIFDMEKHERKHMLSTWSHEMSLNVKEAAEKYIAESAEEDKKVNNRIKFLLDEYRELEREVYARKQQQE